MQERDKRKKPRLFEGFEIAYHKAQMTMKAVTIMFLGLTIFYVAGVYFAYDHFVGRECPIGYTLKFFLAYLLNLIETKFIGNSFFPFHPGNFLFELLGYKVTARAYTEMYLQYIWPHVRDFFTYVVMIYPVWMLFGFIAGTWFFKRVARKEIHETRHLRGARVIKAKELAKRLVKEAKKHKTAKGDRTGLKLTRHIFLPGVFENLHFFIAGSTGTGKSVLIKSILSQIRKREDNCIVFDIKGEYISIFYREGDLIFNPVDTRSIHWNMFKDIKHIDEIKALTNTIIPSLPDTREKFFNDAAREILTAILKILWQKELHTWIALWEVLEGAFSDPKNLLTFFAENRDLGGPAILTYISRLDSGQTQGVISTLQNYCSCFELMARNFPGEGGISLRDWISSAKSSWLYLSIPVMYEETIAPIFTTVVALLIMQVLAFSDGYTKKIWFVLDEFANLLPIPRFAKLISTVRSKNGCVIIGTQTFERLDKIYSPGDRKDIINNCETRIILRLNDPETAQYASKLLGEAEVEEGSYSHSMGVENVRDGMGFSRQNVIKPIVLPSEIMNLKRFQAYIKIGGYNPTLDEIVFRKFEPRVEPFIERSEPGIVQAQTIQTGEPVKEAEQEVVEKTEAVAEEQLEETVRQEAKELNRKQDDQEEKKVQEQKKEKSLEEDIAYGEEEEDKDISY